WHYPSAQWVRECERLVEIDARRDAVLRGETTPASAAESNEYAQLFRYHSLHAASARFRAAAFADDPALADDLKAGHRCAAALAAAGQALASGELSGKERVRWRQQALEWLRADLAANRKLLASGTPGSREEIERRLRRWQCDRDLASLRDKAALAKLPPG